MSISDLAGLSNSYVQRSSDDHESNSHLQILLDDEKLKDEDWLEYARSTFAKEKKSCGSTWWCTLLRTASYVFATSVLFVSLATWLWTLKFTDSYCTRRLNAWSPVIEANAVRYRWETFSVSEPSETRYRGPPTMEREAAWDDLWLEELALDGGIAITEPNLSKLNKSSGIDRQRTASGDYAGFLEVFHQIHCLATLRQYTYRDEYLSVIGKLPAPFQKSPLHQRLHLDHCIEVLRRSILCASDVSITLSEVSPGEQSGYKPDFDGMHKCRDFDAIKEWVHEKSRG